MSIVSRPRRLARRFASRVFGDRPLPLGGVAADRRLLRGVLDPRAAGDVLVVGPGLAVRQTLQGRVDVAGTSPNDAEVTVCSAVLGPRSLPSGRWDTVVVTEWVPEMDQRLVAVQAACRTGGRLFVLDREGRKDVDLALSAVTDVERVVRRGRRHVWIATVRPA